MKKLLKVLSDNKFIAGILLTQGVNSAVYAGKILVAGGIFAQYSPHMMIALLFLGVSLIYIDKGFNDDSGK